MRLSSRRDDGSVRLLVVVTHGWPWKTRDGEFFSVTRLPDDERPPSTAEEETAMAVRLLKADRSGLIV